MQSASNLVQVKRQRLPGHKRAEAKNQGFRVSRKETRAYRPEIKQNIKVFII